MVKEHPADKAARLATEEADQRRIITSSPLFEDLKALQLGSSHYPGDFTKWLGILREWMLRKDITVNPKLWTRLKRGDLTFSPDPVTTYDRINRLETQIRQLGDVIDEMKQFKGFAYFVAPGYCTGTGTMSIQMESIAGRVLVDMRTIDGLISDIFTALYPTEYKDKKVVPLSELRRIQDKLDGLELEMKMALEPFRDFQRAYAPYFKAAKDEAFWMHNAPAKWVERIVKAFHFPAL